MAGTARKTTGTGRGPRKAAPATPKELEGFYDRVSKVDPDTDLDFVSAPEGEEEVRTEKLYSLDGVEYRIPVEFGPHMALVFIDAAEAGELVAVGRVLKDIIGPAGWKALVGFKGLKPEQLSTVLDKVLVKVMGSVEEALKNS